MEVQEPQLSKAYGMLRRRSRVGVSLRDGYRSETPEAIFESMMVP
jgi:hypothetical protein